MVSTEDEPSRNPSPDPRNECKRRPWNPAFSKVARLRPEAEDFGQHSGLGLAIGRAIAEAHDGALEVRDAEQGAGACLVLTLPAA